MNYQLTLLLLLILNWSISYGQPSQKKDSLLAEIHRIKKDTATVLAYLKYGELFESANPDSAVFYYNKARDLSLQLQYPRGTATYISYYNFILNNRGKYREALELCKQALTIYQQLASPKDIAIAQNNLGSEYEYLGSYQSAAEHYLQAIQIAEKIDDRRMVRMLANNLASVFLALKQYDKAYKYALQAYQAAVSMHDNYAIASSLVNRGMAEHQLHRSDSAEKHLLEVIRLGKEVGDYTLELDGLVDLGGLYTDQKKANKAIPFFQQAADVARANENPAYEVAALQGLADAYALLHQWEKADVCIQRATALAAETGDRAALSESYKRSAEIQQGLGSWEKALAYKDKYIQLNDSLLGERTRNHVLDLEADYQTARKDKMLAEQDLALERSAETLRRRNAWLWAAGGGLVIVLLALALSWQRQRMLRLRAVMEGQDQERQRIAKEIHDDIGTGLTSILYLSDGLKEDEEQAVGKIGNTARELIDKMDEIVWSMNKDYDTLEDLLAFLRHHISEWMEVPGIVTHIDFPDQVPSITITGEQRRNIYLVIKEALHNVIRHAGATMVNIEVVIHRHLDIVIRDDGKGMPEGPTRRWGNGLKNMRQRMQHLGGKFEVTGGDGTKVHVSLPLK
jgi:signal transduction histidine kinase